MTTAVEPREHVVDARGLRFHYVEWGSPDAPPIVLLHGLSSMGRIWDPLARTFLDRYRLIALDQRGHGDTSWPAGPDYSTDDYVGDLKALIDGIWGLDRFMLIGLSMGGMNSMAYAARHPERVTRLVVVDIRPALNPEKRPNYELDRYTAEHGHPAFEDLDAALALIRLTNQTTPDEALRHRLHHLLKPHGEATSTFKHDPRVSFHWQPRNLWDELPKISAPTLIVRGGQSQVLPPETAEQMRAAFPRAELITIEAAGHTVPEDTADEFIAAVRGFLERNP